MPGPSTLHACDRPRGGTPHRQQYRQKLGATAATNNWQPLLQTTDPGFSSNRIAVIPCLVAKTLRRQFRNMLGRQHRALSSPAHVTDKQEVGKRVVMQSRMSELDM